MPHPTSLPASKGPLNFLSVRRASLIREAAAKQIASIDKHRPFRDTDFGDGPSLYKAQDIPRIQRLREGIREAETIIERTRELCGLYWMNGLRPELRWVADAPFQRSDAYQSTLSEIRRYLLMNASLDATEGSQSAVAKLTHRLFEQWVFARLVDGFRSAGLRLDPWGDKALASFDTRYVFDLERGTSFQGWLSDEYWIRITYEPWILPRPVADRMGLSLCRGGGEGAAPWSPDIVVERVRRRGNEEEVEYAVVMDCKYTRRLQEGHWRDTRKYLTIRDTLTGRQVARQLWLALPGRDSISSEDDAVQFGDDGPTCDRHETVSFTLRTSPVAHEKRVLEEDAIDDFCSGLLNFFSTRVWSLRGPIV